MDRMRANYFGLQTVIGFYQGQATDFAAAFGLDQGGGDSDAGDFASYLNQWLSNFSNGGVGATSTSAKGRFFGHKVTLSLADAPIFD